MITFKPTSDSSVALRVLSSPCDIRIKVAWTGDTGAKMVPAHCVKQVLAEQEVRSILEGLKYSGWACSLERMSALLRDGLILADARIVFSSRQTDSTGTCTDSTGTCAKFLSDAGTASKMLFPAGFSTPRPFSSPVSDLSAPHHPSTTPLINPILNSSFQDTIQTTARTRNGKHARAYIACLVH